MAEPLAGRPAAADDGATIPSGGRVDGEPHPDAGDPGPHGGEAPRTYPVTPGSDLEYTAGLPEPDQQPVVPAPSTWTPAGEAGSQASPAIDGVAPDRAPTGGGVRATIRGRNLRQVTQVLFGMAPATILAASDDALTVAVPAGTGQVVIAVTTQDGGYAIAGTPFRFGD